MTFHKKIWCFILIAIFNITLIFCNTQPDSQETPPAFEIENVKDYNYLAELSKVVLVLLLIIATLLAVSYFFKKIINNRIKKVNGFNKIRVVEQRTLSPKSKIYVIDIFGHGFVIGETPAGLQKLGNIPKEEILKEEHSKEQFNIK